MKKLSIILTLFTSTLFGQDLSQKANEHYMNYEYHAAFDVLMDMDSTELSDKWNQTILAHAYFACGYTELSQEAAMGVMDNGMCKVMVRFLLKSYMLKYEYENDRKNLRKWKSTFESLGMDKMRTCMYHPYKRMYKVLIQHYECIGDIKASDHFKRKLKRGLRY